MLVKVIIIVILIFVCIFLYETKENMVNNLDLEKDGIIKIKNGKKYYNIYRKVI